MKRDLTPVIPLSLQAKWRIIDMVAVVVVFALIAFRVPHDTNKAEVNQVQGIFIFTDSKPVADYTYLGTIKSSFVSLNPQYTNIRDRLISKLKEKFPQANGAILSFNSGGADKADAIIIQP
jgi:hypothetical protein